MDPVRSPVWRTFDTPQDVRMVRQAATAAKKDFLIVVLSIYSVNSKILDKLSI